MACWDVAFVAFVAIPILVSWIGSIVDVAARSGPDPVSRVVHREPSPERPP